MFYYPFTNTRTAGVDYRWELETQALAKRRGSLHVDVIAGQGRFDDFALIWSFGFILVLNVTGLRPFCIPKVWFAKLTPEREANIGARIGPLQCSHGSENSDADHDVELLKMIVPHFRRVNSKFYASWILLFLYLASACCHWCSMQVHR